MNAAVEIEEEQGLMVTTNECSTKTTPKKGNRFSLYKEQDVKWSN
ncbi:hypothetical protein [Alteribacillus sp. YIM 98480]|nr:hypothetical protein [Alteribacillus sp. YIM 98480]